MINNILIVDLPFSDVVLSLTADKADDIGLVAGALFGFYTDTRKNWERERVANIIGEELRKAFHS